MRETENTQPERDEEVYLCFSINVVCVMATGFTAVSVNCGLKWDMLSHENILEN